MEQVPDISVVGRKPDRQPLYPERPSEGIEAKIQKLADFEAGRVEKIPLTDGERKEVQDREEILGATLEKIFSITPKETTVYVEYLLTPEGKKDFETTLGVTLGEMGTVEDAERALYQMTPRVAGLESKVRSDLAGRSSKYSAQRVFTEFQLAQKSGQMDAKNRGVPRPVTLYLTPEEMVKKLSALEKFKDCLKQYEDIMDDPERSEQSKRVLRGVLRLYQARVNEMLVGIKRDALGLVHKREVVSDAGLTGVEHELLNRTVGIGNTERALARYDKFLFGATTEYDESGERHQVGQELSVFADQFEDDYVRSMLEKEAGIREKGLDGNKIAEKTFGEGEFTPLAEETLQAYGLLSDEPATGYVKERPGPAGDNKWQFVVREEYGTMAVNGKQKVVTCGKDAQSVAGLISIMLAHEIEGHVLQNENKSKIPLRLFRRMGSGRSVIFSECGAMNNQDVVSQEAFGYASPPHPHYIRAMEKKLQGGNYQECVQAFYDSAMKGPSLMKSLGKVSEEEWEKQSQRHLKTAIDRTRRLFGPNADLASGDGQLTKSKDTVYLEQVKLYQELKKHGLEKYVFVGGANLDALLFLMESGFLNPQDIRQPKQHSLEIWKRLQGEYRADGE